MTAHYRKAVRDALASALTGLTTTGSNVFSGRVAPLTSDAMPGLVILPASESAEWGAGDGVVERVLDLTLIAQAFGNEGLYDTLDTISAEIEAAVFADYTLGGKTMWIDPPQMEMNVGEGGGANGAQRLGSLRMSFPVHYRTGSADPTSASS